MKEVMQRAFWDALKEKLSEDPPDTSHAVVLLEEVKQVQLSNTSELYMYITR